MATIITTAIPKAPTMQSIVCLGQTDYSLLFLSPQLLDGQTGGSLAYRARGLRIEDAEAANDGSRASPQRNAY
jgi:hypothetical protein